MLLAVIMMLAAPLSAQPFIHPGIDQDAKDLAYMRKMITRAQEPYASAFRKLKVVVDTHFIATPHTHVLRGPYGRPNIGGDDLSKSANMAYNYALAWCITNEKAYAEKAIAILNAWSPVLWDFDYNDAKLLAAWTGHQLCNAAEILRYTNAGWQQNDIEAFSNMLMSTYYPLLRFYFPQANGNWDGAIIHSLLAMAVFMDNREMYNNAIDHFLHAPVNGSLFKYIYPTGQCQESMRDQGHVQLGLGEFAGAAQVAWTQGTDLLSNNRLALGFEYTAQFLLGETPHCYGKISERAKVLRDDYEFVYRHYASKGIHLKYVQMAADSIRPKASRSVLTAVRLPAGITVKPKSLLLNPGTITGADSTALPALPADAIIVLPGQPVQAALDQAAGSGRWVLLRKGVHLIPHSLKMPAAITLAGEGLGSVIFLDPKSADRDAIVNADNDLHDITIRDLVIEGSNRTETGDDPNSNRSYRGGYNRGAIVLRAVSTGQMKNINLLHLTVQNCTYNGVFISGGAGITVDHCNFNENGGNAVPGPKLQHNLLLTHCTGVTISNSRMDTSPFGSGIALDHCTDAQVTRTEVARNAYYGILLSGCKKTVIKDNHIEANDRSGIMAEYLFAGNTGTAITNNHIQFNNGYGIESYGSHQLTASANEYSGSSNTNGRENIRASRKLIMQ
jgi:Right handed beta helix region/Alginate lyase